MVTMQVFPMAQFELNS